MLKTSYRLVGNPHHIKLDSQSTYFYRQRLAQLDETTQLVARVTAVIGPLSDFAVLATVYPLMISDAQLRDSIKQLETVGILTRHTSQQQSYEFSHALYYESIYRSIPEQQKQLLHGRMGAYLEKRPLPDTQKWYSQLAYHFQNSQDREKAVTYTRQAGEHAAIRFANDEALTHFTQALALADKQALQLRWKILAAKAHILQTTFELVVMKSNLEEMDNIVNTLADTQMQLRTINYWAFYYAASSQASRSLDVGRRGLTLARQLNDSRWQQRFNLLCGYAFYNLDNYPEAARHFQSAYTLAANDTAHREAYRNRADAFHGLGLIALATKNLPPAERYSKQAVVMWQKCGDLGGEAFSVNNLGHTALQQGRFELAYQHFDQALSLWTQIGNTFGQLGGKENQGIVACAVGDYDLAETLFCRNLAESQKLKLPTFQIAALMGIGRVHLAREELFEAQRALQSAFTIQQNEREGKRDTARILNYLGQTYEQRGMLAEAESAYGRALEIRTQIEHHFTALDSRAGLARIALANGDIETACKQAGKITTWLKTKGMSGAEDPIQLYLTLFKVMQASSDLDRARDFLSQGYELLQHRAKQITKPDWHYSYLNFVPHHWQLLALFNDWDS